MCCRKSPRSMRLLFWLQIGSDSSFHLRHHELTFTRYPKKNLFTYLLKWKKSDDSDTVIHESWCISIALLIRNFLVMSGDIFKGDSVLLIWLNQNKELYSVLKSNRWTQKKNRVERVVRSLLSTWEVQKMHLLNWLIFAYLKPSSPITMKKRLYKKER